MMMMINHLILVSNVCIVGVIFVFARNINRDYSFLRGLDSQSVSTA